jgi:hypothetical protein
MSTCEQAEGRQGGRSACHHTHTHRAKGGAADCPFRALHMDWAPAKKIPKIYVHWILRMKTKCCLTHSPRHVCVAHASRACVLVYMRTHVTSMLPVPCVCVSRGARADGDGGGGGGRRAHQPSPSGGRGKVRAHRWYLRPRLHDQTCLPYLEATSVILAFGSQHQLFE